MLARSTLARVLSSPGPFGFAYLVLCVIYLGWTWSHELGDFGGDNALYLLTAQHFSPWSEADTVAAYFVSQSFYPPLYPFVLAIFGGGESLLAAHVITATMLLLAFAVLYAWQRQIGFGRLSAALMVLLFALLPGVLMQALSLLSEDLYLLATLGAVAAVAAYEADRREAWLWTAVVCIAAAVLTRSASIALVAAFVLYLVLHRPKRFWLLIIGALVPMLWQLLSPRAGPGYFSFLTARYAVDPVAGLIAHLTIAVDSLLDSWTVDFTMSQSGISVMGLLGLVCLAGTAYRAVQCKLDGIYGAAYLGLILIWPYPEEMTRLLSVVVPILLVQGMLLLEHLPPVRLRGFALKPSWILPLAIALIMAPSLFLIALRFVQPLPAEYAGFRHTPEWYAPDRRQALFSAVSDKLRIDHLKQIPAQVTEGDCVYSIKPSIVAYYGHRISVISPRPELDDADFSKYLDQNGCRYFFLLGFGTSNYPSRYYPLERMRKSLTIVSVMEVPGQRGAPASILARRETP
jgi:hypothetical protein